MLGICNILHEMHKTNLTAPLVMKKRPDDVIRRRALPLWPLLHTVDAVPATFLLACNIYKQLLSFYTEAMLSASSVQKRTGKHSGFLRGVLAWQQRCNPMLLLTGR